MAKDREWAHAKNRGSEFVFRGRLPRRKNSGGWHRTSGTGVQLPPLPARDAQSDGAARDLRQHLRHRPGAASGRELCRAGRQSPGAERRLLHAGESQSSEESIGLSAEKRFFLGWANVWCQNRTDAFARMLVTIDPHSPGKNRVNGTVSNMPELREAYHCPATAPMVNQNACRVW